MIVGEEGVRVSWISESFGFMSVMLVLRVVMESFVGGSISVWGESVKDPPPDWRRFFLLFLLGVFSLLSFSFSSPSFVFLLFFFFFFRVFSSFSSLGVNVREKEEKRGKDRKNLPE